MSAEDSTAQRPGRLQKILCLAEQPGVHLRSGRASADFNFGISSVDILISARSWTTIFQLAFVRSVEH